MQKPIAPSARRLRSRRILLEALDGRTGVTRAELAALTDLSNSAVAVGVADLMAEGLIFEEGLRGVGTTGRGRRPSVLRRAHPDGHVAGIDFGHAHVRVAVARTDGTVLCQESNPMDVDARAGDALELAIRLFRTLVVRAGLMTEDVLSVGAGIPGPLGPDGRVNSPTILHSWIDLDPAAELAGRLGRPVFVENDADMGAIGEQRFGAARPFTNFLYVKASHGIGASVVIDGRVHRGASGTAGEIGHTHLSGSTARCRCGKQGCLEASISVSEVHRQLQHTHLHRSADGDTIAAEIALDPVGARILSDAGRVVGQIIADGCNWLNPQAIILGGELGTSGPPFIDGVRDSLNRYAQTAIAAAVTVSAAGLALEAELMGAIAVATEHARPAGPR